MFEWKEEYVIGIDIIDEQHKMIFEIAGRAYSLLNNDFYVDKYDKIVMILGELRDYTIFHFQSEEEYMLKIGYKKFFSQKVDHDEFIAKIKNVDLDKIDKNQDAYIMEIIQLITNWLVEHILIKDKQIKIN
jgi:hemerythrin